MTQPTRRTFHQHLLGSLMTYGLIETLFHRNLLADTVKPVIQKWLIDLHDLSRSLKDHKLKDVDFQAKLEELYAKVDLKELLGLLELERISRTVRFPERGAASLGIDLSKIEGLPRGLVFGKQIFALRKDRSVVPLGHDNMCTGFIVLRGDFLGRHYDRVEDNKDHYLIKPTRSALPLAQQARKYLTSKGLTPRVGALVSLPSLDEGQQVARNALQALQDLLSEKVSPLFIVDNDKVKRLIPAPAAQLFTHANPLTLQLLGEAAPPELNPDLTAARSARLHPKAPGGTLSSQQVSAASKADKDKSPAPQGGTRAASQSPAGA